MASYKVTKGTVAGIGREGTGFTDKELEANPGLGGVKRLRDELGVIEDAPDAPSRDPGTIVEHANDPGRGPDYVTGDPAPASRKAADDFVRRGQANNPGNTTAGKAAGEGADPNAGKPRSGKS
jgi:hypothetical protein